MCSCGLLLFEYADLMTLTFELPYHSLARPHVGPHVVQYEQLTAVCTLHVFTKLLSIKRPGQTVNQGM